LGSPNKQKVEYKKPIAPQTTISQHARADYNEWFLDYTESPKKPKILSMPLQNYINSFMNFLTENTFEQTEIYKMDSNTQYNKLNDEEKEILYNMLNLKGKQKIFTMLINKEKQTLFKLATLEEKQMLYNLAPPEEKEILIKLLTPEEKDIFYDLD